MENQRWFEAVKSGNLATIDRMIKSDINLNVKDRYERTVLLIAVEDDKEEVVKRLIKGNHNLIIETLVKMLSAWKNRNRLSSQDIQAWKERFDSAFVNVNIREEGIEEDRIDEYHTEEIIYDVPNRSKWSDWTPFAIAVGNKNEKMVVKGRS